MDNYKRAEQFVLAIEDCIEIQLHVAKGDMSANFTA